MKNRFMYLSLNQRRVSCIVMQVDRVRNTVRYALSCLHDSDSFDREVAQSLALSRLNGNDSREVALPHNASGHQISVAVMKNISRNSSAPTKARRAADRWLAQPVRTTDTTSPTA